ncbi:SOS response associated peptidase (SRAP) [Trinorchestia longiramus]|nr:SOS response associated peptidase (SRAP) [Trinorchestia longiramus]
MCGRTACTLAPDEWCAACRREGLEVDWRDTAKQTFFPSFNVAPTSNTPIIVNGEVFENMTEEKVSVEYVVQPMMWNLVPHFYKGDTPHNHGYKTNNCRVETVLQKPMFSHLMKKGQRCVVLCDGFYEWQTKGKVKIPYFIYSPQPKNVEVWDRSSWGQEEKKEHENDFTEEKGSETWCGLRPLLLAGLFSRWNSTQGEEVWSYTVLTTEAGTSFSWLHHRVPVVLPDVAAVQVWLDPSVPPAAALELVTGDPSLEWHIVSSEVNNSRNKSQQCMMPAQQKKETQAPSNPIMAGWLKKGNPSSLKDVPLEGRLKREQDSDQESETPKKLKP